MQKILFVCTGNICRSPTAEGVIRHYIDRAGLSKQFKVDSAGTHGYHIGEAPDPRSIKTALKRGIDISNQRARKISPSDFHDFDLILALDNGHLQHLRAMAPAEAAPKIALFLQYAAATVETEVPDPYYGGQAGFDHVLDLIETAAMPLITKHTTG
jgi:protein-tyrosine phosphatase